MASKAWSIALVALAVAFTTPASASHLNKTAIIDQSESTYNNVTASEIQSYLNTTGTQLASYTIPVEFEVYYPIGLGQWDKVTVRQEWQSNIELEVYHGKSFAQLVGEFSTTDRSARSPSSPGKINPLVALATIDKESASITGSYRTNIVSERPITMSWLMGYGFDGTMDSCVKTGNCDITYNRNRATWYGGPGQQIAEGVSALKRWSTSPTTINQDGSCSGGWEKMKIEGECLTLQNTISYALYRYTPSFSGQELFINLYATIKSNFPFPPPPVIENDTSLFSLRTYNQTVTITGTKRSDNRAYFGQGIIAYTGPTSWQYSFEPEVGRKTYTITYIDPNGNTSNTKTIEIVRHRSGDVNNDSKVDLLDLSIIATYWGHSDPPEPMANLNPDVDNEVNIIDLSLMAANWNG